MIEYILIRWWALLDWLNENTTVGFVITMMFTAVVVGLLFVLEEIKKERGK